MAMLSDAEVDDIWTLGKAVDLSDCHYGLFHDNKTYLHTSPYYYFLCGVAKYSSAEKIVEIGTYRGGSTKALSKGMAEGGKLLTFDVSDFEPDFRKYPNVKSIVADPLDASSIMECRAYLGNTVDLIYIDGTHNGAITLKQMKTYVKAFSPRWVVCDDVGLSQSMRDFFSAAERAFPGFRDVSRTHPHIRRPAEGFGVWKNSNK